MPSDIVIITVSKTFVTRANASDVTTRTGALEVPDEFCCGFVFCAPA